MARVKVGELFKGCRAGRVQSAGLMTVIPLLSELEDARFVAPRKGAARVSTSTYGTVRITNTQDRPIIVPAGATYIVEQKAQNHAMPSAGWVKGKGVAAFDTAACVQQTQAGTIADGEHEMMLLPAALREKSHAARRQKDFRKMWPAIAAFNERAGLAAHAASGHLEHFFARFAGELEQFVAEFEPVPGQVGAIVLVGGKVAGVERCPSQEYFRDVWRPLIRECYGSMAVIEAAKAGRKGGQAAPPPTRVPLREAASLDDLEAALAEAEASERQKAAALAHSVMALELEATTDERGELTLDAFDGQQMVGQAIRSGESVVYASLVACEKWAQRGDWLAAEAFAM
jgi:hypothetical protein